MTQLRDLEQALSAVDRLLAQSAAIKSRGAWPAEKIFDHCAQSLEYAVRGFPKLKPALIRATIGPLVLSKFLRQGFMKHKLTAEIPGAPGPTSGDPKAALLRLRAAIEAFVAQPEPLAPHFVYGAVAKDRYGQVQAMHLADHLSEIEPPT